MTLSNPNPLANYPGTALDQVKEIRDRADAARYTAKIDMIQAQFVALPGEAVERYERIHTAMVNLHKAACAVVEEFSK